MPPSENKPKTYNNTDTKFDSHKVIHVFLILTQNSSLFLRAATVAGEQLFIFPSEGACDLNLLLHQSSPVPDAKNKPRKKEANTKFTGLAKKRKQHQIG